MKIPVYEQHDGEAYDGFIMTTEHAMIAHHNIQAPEYEAAR